MEAQNPDPQKNKPARSAQLFTGQPEIPPQAVDVEQAVLGAILIDSRAVSEVIDMLRSEIFYEPKHQIIFQAIVNLFDQSGAIDLLTVRKQLEHMGKLREAGGEYYLLELSRKVTSSAHIEHHARILLEKYMRRKMIEVSHDMKKDAYDETKDVFDILDRAEQNIYSVSQGTMKQDAEPVDNILIRVRNEIEEITKESKLPGVPSGFADLDRITSGWQRGDLIILAARPSMGKTAFALHMARNIAFDHDMAVAFFSLEMSAEQLLKRILANETQINASKFRSGNFTEEELERLNDKIKEISEHPKLFINDTSYMTIFDLRAQARRLKSKENIQIIFIDYLQLMHVSDRLKPGNREQEISTISRGLKALAKELDIPIVALSQLSRKVEDRYKDQQHRRPQLSDLRESGAIEQDADIVTFLYRPDYYNITVWDREPEGPTDNQVELIIAKHRNGATGSIRLWFFKNHGRFLDINYQDNMPQVLDSKINHDLPDNIKGNLPDTGQAFGPPGDNGGSPENNPNDDVPF